MRAIIALAGLVGLVAIGVWKAPQWMPERDFGSGFGAAADGSAADPESKVVRVSGKNRGDKTGRSTVTSDFKIGGFPDSKIEVDVPVSRAPFPTRKDLHAGIPGSQVRATYGEPAARITAMEGGQLVERYYYFNNDRTQLTVAKLEQGVVVAAEAVPR